MPKLTHKIIILVNNPLALGGMLSEVYWYRRNGLGDVVGVVRADGRVAARYEYDIWGNHRVLDESGGAVAASDEWHIGNVNPWRWGGRYYDAESGLYAVYDGLMTRYYDPRLGVVINAALDEAMTEGGYGYGATNPWSVFGGEGSVLSEPTWGYPKVYDCECGPGQGCNYEPWERPRIRWWHWVGASLSGPFAIPALVLLGLQAGGVIDNRNVWRATNAMTAVGLAAGGVALGVATGGLLAKPLKIGFGAAFGTAIKSGVVISGVNFVATGFQTNWFLDMDGGHAARLFGAAFGGGLGGALGVGIAGKFKSQGLGKVATGFSVSSTAAVTNAIINITTSPLTGGFTPAGLIIAIIGGLGTGLKMPTVLETLIEILLELIGVNV